MAIGDRVLDMAGVEEAGLVVADEEPCYDLPLWNDPMDLAPEVWDTLQARLMQIPAEGAAWMAFLGPIRGL